MSDPSLIDAFPRADRSDAEIALGVLTESDLHRSHFTDPRVTLEGEAVWIPSRIYHVEPSRAALEGLTPRRRAMVHCLLTRHHDGYVRQRHVAAAATSDARFAIPFLVMAADDYVVEVVEAVLIGLADLAEYPSRRYLAYGRFLYDNPSRLELVRQRTISFWNAYYRDRLSRDDYPGFKLLEAFDRVVRHEERKPGRQL